MENLVRSSLRPQNSSTEPETRPFLPCYRVLPSCLRFPRRMVCLSPRFFVHSNYCDGSCDDGCDASCDDSCDFVLETRGDGKSGGINAFSTGCDDGCDDSCDQSCNHNCNGPCHSSCDSGCSACPSGKYSAASTSLVAPRAVAEPPNSPRPSAVTPHPHHRLPRHHALSHSNQRCMRARAGRGEPVCNSGGARYSATCPGLYFNVVGPCTVYDNCVRSPNYPSAYGYSESCTITPTSRAVGQLLSATAFNTESCCDKLIVNGATYQGTIGPSNVLLGSAFRHVVLGR